MSVNQQALNVHQRISHRQSVGLASGNDTGASHECHALSVAVLTANAIAKGKKCGDCCITYDIHHADPCTEWTLWR